MNEHAGSMRVLIVEDDDVLRRSFVRALKPWSQNIHEAATLRDAEQALGDKPDLVILDVNLPDGCGVSLAQSISRIRPMPLTIAVSGEASAEQAFQLSELGVRGYLPKPLSLQDFIATIEKLMNTPPDLDPHISAVVGKSSVKQVNSRVRKTMLEQALSLSKGNITRTAGLLSVSRQAVQQMINDFGINIEHYK